MITLFHGSPHNVDNLTPSVPRGETKFQTTNAVFFTDNERMAQLYAIARDKNRKRKHWFLHVDDGARLHILEQPVNTQGYVYVSTQKIKNTLIGVGQDVGQFAVTRKVTPSYRYIIKSDDVKQYIHFYTDKQKLKDMWEKLK